MIEDEELRALFATESEEHLQSLDEGLLRLEASPREASTLEEVFRAAHSLKGTARMLGVDGVETLAHHLEDELGGAKRGRILLDSHAIDRLCFGVDAIRRFVREAVSGTPCSIDLTNALSQLAGHTPLDSAHAAPPAPEEPAPEELAPSKEEQQEAEAGPDEMVPPEFASRLKYLQEMSALQNQQEASGQMQPAAYEEPEQAAAETKQTDLKYLQAQGAPFVIEHAAIPLPPAAAPPALEAATPGPLVEAQLVVAPPAVLAAPEPGGVQEASIQAVVEALPEGGEVAPAEFKIQTMRVPPARLDALMTLASELSVTTTRVARGLSLLDALHTLADEWSKDSARTRGTLGSLLQVGSHSEGEGSSLRRLSEFHEREQVRLLQLEATLEDMARLSFVAGEMEEGIRDVRLLPFSTIFSLFARPVRDLAREQQKEVQLLVEGGETPADKRILEELKDPLLHMIRNSIDHGVEVPEARLRANKPRLATLRLRARQTASNVIVELSDDGRGLSLEGIKRAALKRRLHTPEELEAMPDEQIHALIFAPGFSTSTIITDVSGRGVGMDVVRTNVEKLKGMIQVRSEPGHGTSFLIRLPITLASTRVLLVQVGAQPYAIPIEFVHSLMPVAAEQFFTVEGRDTILFEDKALVVARLSDLLEVKAASSQSPASKATCVVLEVGEEKAGLLVDALLDEQEVMLKPLGAMLKRVRNISGATILGTGEVCLILNPHDLLKSMHLSQTTRPLSPSAPDEVAQERRKLVLLAEDSLATRTLEKRILEAAGYQVVTAVDGADAFAKLGSHPFDAVVSDIEMPNLSGLGLAARIRQDARYNELPIILVTSLASEDDRRRGAEAGANAYITKGSFEQKALLDALGRLV